MPLDPLVTSLVLHDIRLDAPRQTLMSYRDRGTAPISENFWHLLKDLKRQSVEVNDQGSATACWCLEQIGKIQDHFTKAYTSALDYEFYSAWNELEQADVALGFLRDHFLVDSEPFGLTHIEQHVPRLQSLFPYKLFLSPGMVVRSAHCSICNERIKLRGGCNHKVGQIYDGEMCARIITDVELLEISVVNAPVQKYSVLFGPDITYNYRAVWYVVVGLKSLWDGWTYELSEKVSITEGFPGMGRNTECGCGSGRKYKVCCRRKRGLYPHYEIIFERPPPSGHPPAVDATKLIVEGSPNQSRNSEPSPATPHSPSDSA